MIVGQLNIPVLSIIVSAGISFMLGAVAVALIGKTNNRIIEFFEDVPDATGKRPLSYSRLTGFMLAFAYLNWGTYIVYITHTIPDFPVWFAAFLAALYGFNTSDIKIGGSK